MAHPFHKLPTFAEFKDKLANDYQITFNEGGQVKIDADGPRTTYYFERNGLTYPFRNFPDDALIEFEVIRSVCKHFDIDFEADNLYGLGFEPDSPYSN